MLPTFGITQADLNTGLMSFRLHWLRPSKSQIKRQTPVLSSPTVLWIARLTGCRPSLVHSVKHFRASYKTPSSIDKWGHLSFENGMILQIEAAHTVTRSRKIGGIYSN